MKTLESCFEEEPWYVKEKKNCYSQHGEDGIIEYICEKLKLKNGFFIEFGAWDGKYRSNTYYLYEKGWEGLYIEGDKIRFKELEKNIPDPNIIKINSFIEVSGENHLEKIIERSGIDHKIVELLSIDIDSDDLAIWMSLSKLKPKIVIIEYNYTIPIDVNYINPKGKQKGNSARTIYTFALNSGYRLVAGTKTNLFLFEMI